MPKLLNKSNRTRNKRKKTAARVKSFRIKQKLIQQIENSFIVGNEAALALFDAYAKSQDEYDELCRLYNEEAKNSPEISYIPQINLLDTWKRTINH